MTRPSSEAKVPYFGPALSCPSGRITLLCSRAAAIILILTALLKLVAAASESAFLARYDPVFPFVTIRQMALLAACLELLVAWSLVRRPLSYSSALLLVWLVLLFTAYHFARWAIGYDRPCPCLGSLPQWLSITDTWARRLTPLALLLLASTAVLGIMGLHKGNTGDTIHTRNHPPAR